MVAWVMSSRHFKIRCEAKTWYMLYGVNGQDREMTKVTCERV